MVESKDGGKLLKITLVKGFVGQRESHRRTLLALGLRRRHQTVIHRDTPTIRGMIEKVRHMVHVEPVEV
jgi:large subunit ribosomal protein L30